MTAAAQAAIPAACMVAADPAVTSRNAPTGKAGRDAIARAWNASDKHWDRYAETGCFAALGDAHRADALLLRLLEGEGRAG